MTVRIDCPTCAIPSPLSEALGIVGMKRTSFADYYEAGADKHFKEGYQDGLDLQIDDVPSFDGEGGPVNVLMYLVGMLAGHRSVSRDGKDNWETPHCKTGEHDVPDLLPVTGADTDVPKEYREAIQILVNEGSESDSRGTVEHGGSYFATIEIPVEIDEGNGFDMHAWGHEVNTYGQKAFYKFTTNEDARQWLSAMEG